MSGRCLYVYEPHAMSSDDEEVPDDICAAVTVCQIWAIKVGKYIWMPDTQTIGATTYFRLSKYDSKLTKLCMGKSLNRSNRRSKVSLTAKKFWRTVQGLRKDACNEAIRNVLLSAMRDAGETPAENHTFRPAREGDEWLIRGQCVDVQVPDQSGNMLTLKMAFHLKGDVFVELTEANVRWGVLQSVLQSDAPKLVVILTLEKVGEVMRSMKTQWLLLRVRWRNDMCR